MLTKSRPSISDSHEGVEGKADDHDDAHSGPAVATEPMKC